MSYNPEATFPEGHAWAGRPRCQARNRKGEQCGKLASKKTRKVCKNHGGASLNGVEHPNWKHGKYEQRGKAGTPFYESVAETRWRSAYMRFLESADALSLDPDIALNAARLDDMIANIETSVTFTFIEDVEGIVADVKEAMASNDIRGLARGVVRIDELCAAARKGLIAQDRLDRLISQRMSLVGGQQRAIEKQERHLAVGQVVSLILRLFGIMLDVIEENTDEAVFQVITERSRLALRDSLIYLGSETMIEGNAEDVT